MNKSFYENPINLHITVQYLTLNEKSTFNQNTLTCGRLISTLVYKITMAKETFCLAWKWTTSHLSSSQHYSVVLSLTLLSCINKQAAIVTY